MTRTSPEVLKEIRRLLSEYEKVVEAARKAGQLKVSAADTYLVHARHFYAGLTTEMRSGAVGPRRLVVDVSPNFIGRPPTHDFEDVLTDSCPELNAVTRLSEQTEQDYRQLVTTFRGQRGSRTGARP